MKDARPLVTIITPAYDSEATLRLSLESVAKQTLDPKLVEHLVIDGGSSDRTREIAAEFGCRIVDNPKRQPEFAKLLGLEQARGTYALFLDSDEVLYDSHSLENKIRALREHPEVRNVITAGLLTPPGYPAINDYSNSFGEPFSYFMYRLDGSEYVRSLKARYGVCYEDDRIVILGFGDDELLPICDGGGHCFDLEYLKSIADVADPALVPVVFGEMARRTQRLAVVKGDYTLHYSTTTLRRYLNKIRWRVIANAHRATGTEGFVQRDAAAPAWFKVKKYLFLLYGLTIVGPLVDALRLALHRRKAAFLVHLPLSVYTVGFIAYQYALKALGITPKLESYGS